MPTKFFRTKQREGVMTKPAQRKRASSVFPNKTCSNNINRQTALISMEKARTWDSIQFSNKCSVKHSLLRVKDQEEKTLKCREKTCL